MPDSNAGALVCRPTSVEEGMDGASDGTKAGALAGSLIGAGGRSVGAAPTRSLVALSFSDLDSSDRWESPYFFGYFAAKTLRTVCAEAFVSP